MPHRFTVLSTIRACNTGNSFTKDRSNLDSDKPRTFLLLVCTNCQPVNRRLSTDDNSRLQFFLCIQVKNKYAKQNTVFELQFNFFEKTFRISGFTICSLPHRQRTADGQNLVITVTVYLLRSVFLFTLVNYRVHGHRPSVLPPLSFIPFHAVKLFSVAGFTFS